ncbi:MAG: YtxH domain-containing protein [Syntrophorhabdales bacterium]|jgi:gas vesicle protein
MENEKSCGNGYLVASSFLLGGLIGAAVGLLSAPKSGKEVRRQVRDLAGNVKGKAGDYYEQIREAVTSALVEGKGLIDEKKRLITKAVQAGIDACQKEKEEMEGERIS